MIATAAELHIPLQVVLGGGSLSHLATTTIPEIIRRLAEARKVRCKILMPLFRTLLDNLMTVSISGPGEEDHLLDKAAERIPDFPASRAARCPITSWACGQQGTPLCETACPLQYTYKMACSGPSRSICVRVGVTGVIDAPIADNQGMKMGRRDPGITRGGLVAPKREDLAYLQDRDPHGQSPYSGRWSRHEIQIWAPGMAGRNLRADWTTAGERYQPRPDAVLQMVSETMLKSGHLGEDGVGSLCFGNCTGAAPAAAARQGGQRDATGQDQRRIKDLPGGVHGDHLIPR